MRRLVFAWTAAVALAVAARGDGEWGVNYYAPFSLDYNELSRRGVDHRTAIRDDVTHLRRLGVDYIRVHCFDRQISRRDGSLAETRHLDLLDYLVATAVSNGLKTVLTPIAWYGWAPMDDVAREGFSNLATMQEFTSKRELWKLQTRFLAEFAAHTNRYTGIAYGKDPAILAFECVNEPLYPKDWPQTNVTAYINALVEALRTGGAVQPIFYNSWNGYNEALGKSKADGASCSAYPLGLLNGRALRGPQLGRIRESTLKPDCFLSGKRRMAYEFDAADTLDACLYPAIAKMLRGEGVEFAAQFQYDPLALADVNRNWHTHYLNLVYTPRKALSFAIAGRAFKSVPKGETFVPASDRMAFGPFRVDALRNLSEMVTADEYLYSNDPVTPPPDPVRLVRVWGCGRSSVVASDGSGAYFLDRVADGVWRLQLYPNAFTVADPFAESDAVKTAIVPGEVKLTVRLPDLGASFVAKSLSGEGDLLRAQADGSVLLTPGDFVLMRAGTDVGQAVDVARAAKVPRYVAPSVPKGEGRPCLRADIPTRWKAGRPLPVSAEGVFADRIGVEMRSVETGEVRRFAVRTTELPADALAAGTWDVCFAASGRYGKVRYPEKGHLRLTVVSDYRDWNFVDAPRAASATPQGVKCVRRAVRTESGADALQVGVPGFAPDGSTVLQFRCDYGTQTNFFYQAPTATVLVVRARATEAATSAFELTMVEHDLKSWKYEVPLTGDWREIRLPVGEGRYCGDWPWVPKLRPGDRPDVGRPVCIRLSFGAWLYGADAAKPQGFELESIRVE